MKARRSFQTSGYFTYPLHCVTSQKTRNLNTNAMKLISHELLLSFRDIVFKSGSLKLLEPSWPLQACNGIALLLPCTWHQTKYCARRIARSNITNTILKQTHPSPALSPTNPSTRSSFRTSKWKFSKRFPHEYFVRIIRLLNDSHIPWVPWCIYPTMSVNCRWKSM